MATLYDLTSEWIEIEDQIAEAGGELTPEIEARIESLISESEGKLESYVRVIRDYRARAAVRKEEAERLEKSAKSASNTADFLESRLLQHLRVRNVTDPVKAGPFTIKRAKAGGSLPLQIVGEVPTDYLVQKITYSPDNQLIRNDLAAGKDLPFARLGERKEALKIS